MESSYLDPGMVTSHSWIAPMTNALYGKSVNTVFPQSPLRPIMGSTWEWTNILEDPIYNIMDSLLAWRMSLKIGACSESVTGLPWEHQMVSTSPGATTAGFQQNTLTQPSFIWAVPMSHTPYGGPLGSPTESGLYRLITASTWQDVPTVLPDGV